MRTVIGVMGSGRPLSPSEEKLARDVGRLVAEQGWTLLNGGRCSGAMDASARGAHEAGGLVIGILPDRDLSDASEHLDVAIVTGMGEARNVVNVLTCEVVIALPGGAGTLSEIALALQAGKPVVAIGWELGTAFQPWRETGRLVETSSAEDGIAAVRSALGSRA